MHLRELSRLPAGVAVSAIVALLAAVWSVASIGLLPPRLTPRSLEMATAHTQVVVDTPESAILDLRQPANLDALKNRAVLVGTLMGSPPVRAYIARRAHVVPSRLQVQAPRTPEQPRPTADSGQKKGARDLLRSTDQYRLDVQTNPTVPIIDIYAQAPSARSAAQLADAAVAGLGDYMGSVARSDGTPQDAKVRLRQLGRARGTVINQGIEPQLAVLTFVLVFGVACVATVAVARIRRGFALAPAAEH